MNKRGMYALEENKKDNRNILERVMEQTKVLFQEVKLKVATYICSTFSCNLQVQRKKNVCSLAVNSARCSPP
jgi:hypothetical protein